MQNIKCKFGCEGGHPTAVCTRFAKAKGVPAPAAQRVKAVAARPVKLGSKGKAKKRKKP